MKTFRPDRMSNEPPTSVSVVVPTFRRPERLAATVQSIFAQEACDDLDVEIIVVDNDPSGSARTTACELKGRFPIAYHLEPRPGVSNARNRGLDEARGQVVVFIDDDEIAERRWLAALLDAHARFDAEVVFGPVIAHNSDQAKAAEFLTCSLDAPTGTRVGSSLLTPFWSRDRSLGYPRLCSGNVLMDRAMLVRTGARFDPALGLTGGEDTLFFNQLAADGVSMVWCAEASVTEPLPDERTGFDYLIQRAFRGGQITSFVPMRLQESRPALTALSMAIGACQIAVYGPLAAYHHAVGAPARHESSLKTAMAAGKLLWSARFRARAYGVKSMCVSAIALRILPNGLFDSGLRCAELC